VFFADYFFKSNLAYNFSYAGIQLTDRSYLSLLMEINGSAGVSENAVDRIVVKSF
ncbi:hypothetical protein QUC31_006266, partial [Theobroma cacao]